MKNSVIGQTIRILKSPIMSYVERKVWVQPNFHKRKASDGSEKKE